MTGTAIEAAGELRAVYGLRVIRIPTNRALQRTKVGTRMFPTAGQKWNAVVEAVNAVSHQGRAVLIGTRSVEASERVGELLRKSGLNPVILNARQDRLEADIVAEAGQPGRITVATNMAGRGTDIQLHRDVREAGGLHVILTEYHESARIDRQLFGRSGCQGDPGSYESIVALDDELFQRFAGRLALRAAAGALRRSDRVQAAIAIGLRRVCQSAAERLHAGTRRLPWRMISVSIKCSVSPGKNDGSVWHGAARPAHFATMGRDTRRIARMPELASTVQYYCAASGTPVAKDTSNKNRYDFELPRLIV